MAWKACEMEIGDALDRRELRGDQIAIAHLEADFQGELVEGEAEFDVRIHRVGTSSVDFRVVVAREGGIAATVSVTLVHVDPQTKTSVPLSQEHRGALASRVAG
jgi:acyl-CoA thioesterase FadM